MRRLAGALAAAAVAVLLGAAGTASASTLAISNGVLVYMGAPSEANHVTLSYDFSHGVYVVDDPAVPSMSVASSGQFGCHSYSAKTAYCTLGSFASIAVHLGNGGSFAQSTLAITPVTMYAGTGNDTLIGGGGADTLIGGPGTDTLTAGAGNTKLIAGSGNTTLNGGSGHDTYEGGPGADTINARNAVTESITCGAGNDTVTDDVADVAAGDCEAVNRGVGVALPPGTAVTGGASNGASVLPALGPLPGLPAHVQPPAPAVSLASPTVGPHNTLPVEVACPALVSGYCDGSVTLSLAPAGTPRGRMVAARRGPSRVLGSKRFHVRPGHKAIVRVVLSRRTARIFRTASKRRRTLKLVASVVMRSEAGTHTTTRTLTVHIARRRPMPVGHRNRSGQ